MADRYGMNLRGAIVERNPGDPAEEYELLWQAGHTVCASDGGMNLLLSILNDWATRQQPESTPLPIDETAALRARLETAESRVSAACAVLLNCAGELSEKTAARLYNALHLEVE